MQKKILLISIIIILFLISGVAVIFIADFNFNSTAREEVVKLFAGQKNEERIITESQTESLPHPVKKWLKSSGVIGKAKVNFVRLRQKGFMRTEIKADWIPFEAEQYFRTEDPGFIWRAKVRLGWGIFITAMDKFSQGKGSMIINLLSLLNIGDSKGDKIDQGVMLRYLAEIVWFPSAALSPYMQWKEIDSTSAGAVMNYKNTTVSGIFFFNDNGDITAFEAMRYGEFDGKFSLEKWRIDITGYSSFEGIRVPQKCRVTWKVKAGDFCWLNLEIKELEFNRAYPY